MMDGDQGGYSVSPQPALQASPFQALLEQAIAQEMRRPQGRYQSAVTGNYRAAGPRTYYDEADRPRTYMDPGEPNDMAALVSAGAHNDAVANASQGQRLGTLMGGYGQVVGANADTARTRLMADELAWKQSPAGLRYAATLGGIGAGSITPQTDPEMFGRPPNPGVEVGKVLGLQPGVAPPQSDQALADFENRGGTAGSPGAAAIAEMYPETIRGRLAGERQHWYEQTLGTPGVNVGDVLQGGLPVFARKVLSPMVYGAEGRTPRQQAEERAARLYPQGLTTQAVGVPAQASPAARPGVRRSMVDEASARNERFRAIARPPSDSLLTGK